MDERNMNVQNNMNGLDNDNVAMPKMEEPVQPSMPSMEVPVQPSMPSMEVPVQPSMPNVEVPVQTETIGVPTVNLMEDFSQLVTPETEDTTTSINPVNNVEVKKEAEPLESEKTKKEDAIVENTSTDKEVLTKNNDLNTVSVNSAVVEKENVAPAEVGQVSVDVQKTTKKEKSNWVFIGVLFSIVGICILLFPLVVRILGY